MIYRYRLSSVSHSTCHSSSPAHDSLHLETYSESFMFQFQQEPRSLDILNAANCTGASPIEIICFGPGLSWRGAQGIKVLPFIWIRALGPTRGYILIQLSLGQQRLNSPVFPDWEIGQKLKLARPHKYFEFLAEPSVSVNIFRTDIKPKLFCCKKWGHP